MTDGRGARTNRPRVLCVSGRGTVTPSGPTLPHRSASCQKTDIDSRVLENRQVMLEPLCPAGAVGHKCRRDLGPRRDAPGKALIEKGPPAWGDALSS